MYQTHINLSARMGIKSSVFNHDSFLLLKLVADNAGMLLPKLKSPPTKSSDVKSEENEHPGGLLIA